VWRVPPVLVIQLKRFKHGQFGNRKLENLVTFQLDDLDLSGFMPTELDSNIPAVVDVWKFLGGVIRKKGAQVEGSAVPEQRTS